MSGWLQHQAEQATPLDTAAWAVGLTALAVYALPILVTACGLVLLRMRPYDDPRLAAPDPDDADATARAGELLALGFAPEGVIRERVWLSMQNVRKTFTPQFHRSRDGHTLAALYRMTPESPVRVSLAGLTPAGCLVRTVMPGAGIPQHDPDHRRTEHPWLPVAELFAEHRRQAVEAGGTVPLTLGEYARRDEAIERRGLRELGLCHTHWFLVVGWLLPFLVAVGLFALLTHAPEVRLISLGVVVAGVCYPLLAFWLLDKLMAGGEWCEAATADGASAGYTTPAGVGVQEVADIGRYILSVTLAAVTEDELGVKLADARAVLSDWVGMRPDGQALLTAVAARPLWPTVEARVRATLAGHPGTVQVGILDGSDAPARQFVLGPPALGERPV